MSKAEIQYFLTFAAGIAAFFLGGQVAAHLGLEHNRLAAEFLGRGTILAVFGLGLAIVLTFTLGRSRSPKAILIPVVIVMALAYVAALVLVRLGAGHIHSRLELGLFTMMYYIIYGLLYVIGGVIARRLART